MLECAVRVGGPFEKGDRLRAEVTEIETQSIERGACPLFQQANQATPSAAPGDAEKGDWLRAEVTENLKHQGITARRLSPFSTRRARRDEEFR